MEHSGAVACGHTATADAAVEILGDGGNAFDAAIAAQFTACVAEPVLASLGGGGFMLAWWASGAPRLFDFFAQTPRSRRGPADGMYPIEADFGPARQTFHIGGGSIATPGTVAGMFAAHGALGSLPMSRLLEPAIRAARQGVAVSDFQHYVLQVVQPIYGAVPPYDTARPGERLPQPELAGSLEALASEGEALFYQGEIAAKLARLCEDLGGHLSREDLAGYRVVERQPLRFRHRAARILSNPPPSAGGVLIRHSLAALDTSPADSAAVYRALLATDRAKQQLSPDADQVSRGTTHISVADAAGNLAALTLSNGEGCGHLIPGTGIMPNNMLGEEDINPAGIGHWVPDRRLGSMMAPTLVLTDRWRAALGSGGSNRIRSAVFQALVALVDKGLSPEAMVQAPRMHVENDLLSLEPGLDPAELGPLAGAVQCWDERNLFFGGVHVVTQGPHGRLQAAADPRRGGAARLA